MTPNAVIWPQAMDPQDTVEYVIDCSPLLLEGESIQNFSLAVPAESQLFGLRLGTGDRAASRDGSRITLWISFNNADIPTPITLPIEVTIVTNSVPSRTRQRTVAVKVDQL